MRGCVLKFIHVRKNEWEQRDGRGEVVQVPLPPFLTLLNSVLHLTNVNFEVLFGQAKIKVMHNRMES